MSPKQVLLTTILGIIKLTTRKGENMKKHTNGIVLGIILLISISITGVYAYLEDVFRIQMGMDFNTLNYFYKSYGLAIISLIILGMMFAYFSKNINVYNFTIPLIINILLILLYLTPILPFFGFNLFSIFTVNPILTVLIMNKAMLAVIFIFLGSTIYGIFTNAK